MTAVTAGEAAGKLQKHGIIRYARGQITVLGPGTTGTALLRVLRRCKKRNRSPAARAADFLMRWFCASRPLIIRMLSLQFLKGIQGNV
jgi:hypothetical protein